MSKVHVEKWVQNCIVPYLNDKTLIMINSWSAQEMDYVLGLIQKNIRSKNHCEKNAVSVSTIPPGITALCQPNDVYFLRQWKVIVHKIYDRFILDELDIPQDRNFIHYKSTVISAQSVASPLL